MPYTVRYPSYSSDKGGKGAGAVFSAHSSAHDTAITLCIYSIVNSGLYLLHVSTLSTAIAENTEGNECVRPTLYHGMGSTTPLLIPLFQVPSSAEVG